MLNDQLSKKVSSKNLGNSLGNLNILPDLEFVPTHIPQSDLGQVTLPLWVSAPLSENQDVR